MIDKKELLRAISLDFDGCLFHRKYAQDPSYDKDVLTHNHLFLKTLRSENTLFSAVRVLVGSGRQSFFNDRAGWKFKGSCFPALLRIAEHLQATPDLFLMADVYGDLEEGDSFRKALDYCLPFVKQQGVESGGSESALGGRPFVESEHARWIFDESKITLLYAQLHKIAREHPVKEIVFDFFDDREDILSGLKRFYTDHPDLIPSHTILRLHRYAGGSMMPIAIIMGTGKMDLHYRDTVKEMARVVYSAEYGSDYNLDHPNPIFTTAKIRPDLLLSRVLVEDGLKERRKMRSVALSTGLRVEFLTQLEMLRQRVQQLDEADFGDEAAVLGALYEMLQTYSDGLFSGKLSGTFFRATYVRLLNEAKGQLKRPLPCKDLFYPLTLAAVALSLGCHAWPSLSIVQQRYALFSRKCSEASAAETPDAFFLMLQ